MWGLVNKLLQQDNFCSAIYFNQSKDKSCKLQFKKKGKKWVVSWRLGWQKSHPKAQDHCANQNFSDTFRAYFQGNLIKRRLPILTEHINSSSMETAFYTLKN